MNATQMDDMLCKIDSAVIEVRRAVLMLTEAEDGADNADLLKCTMHHAKMALANALADLKAAGAN